MHCSFHLSAHPCAVFLPLYKSVNSDPPFSSFSFFLIIIIKAQVKLLKKQQLFCNSNESEFFFRIIISDQNTKMLCLAICVKSQNHDDYHGGFSSVVNSTIHNHILPVSIYCFLNEQRYRITSFFSLIIGGVLLFFLFLHHLSPL